MRCGRKRSGLSRVPPLPSEFELIGRYFRPLAAGQPGALGLQDDAALIEVRPDHRLVVTADALVAGVHFLADDPAELIARKMLRANLSDLAAMGSTPLVYVMTIALPPWIGEPWLSAFVAGLAADQAAFRIGLLGGDTTATPGPLTLSVTAFGEVRRGRELRRSGARAGDLVLASGTIGDAALGLRVRQGGLASLPALHRSALVDRYLLPQPRVALGQALAEAGVAHAAIDVSDGLVADLGHVCCASGCAATVAAADVPLSSAAAAALAMEPDLISTVLTGGDDYELLIAAAPEAAARIDDLGARLGLPLTRIGRIEDGAGVRVLDESGDAMRFDRTGFRHM